MRLFRSREMKGLTLACLLLTAALAALGFFLESRFGWFALAVCGGVSGAAIAGYGLHLLRLDKLTLSMQRVLRGEGTIPLSQNREGEYAFFEHELYKLSQALRTQVEASQADKR